MIKKTIIFLLVIIGVSISVGTTPKVTAASAISAQSAILIEQSTGKVMYERNSDEQLLTASIAKIMTTLVAIENADLNDKVKISEDATKQIGSSIYAKQGDQFALRDLLYAVMLRSGNDASYAVAEYVGDGDADKFVYMMNETAKKIGMTNSTFENMTGLDETSKNYSTAYDMAMLTRYAMNNADFVEISGTEKHTARSEEGTTYVWYHKHKLVTAYDYIKGGKTGYTEAAKRTLVTFAQKDDMKLIVVTFNDSNDWVDHKNLFDYGYNNYSMKTLLPAGQLSDKNIFVQEPLYINQSIQYPIKDSEENNLQLVVKLLNTFDEESDIVGQAELYDDGELVYTEPISKYLITNTASKVTITNVYESVVEWIKNIIW